VRRRFSLRVVGRRRDSPLGFLAGKEDRMNALWAHHVELYHVPVLLVLFAAGAWIGFSAMARWLRGGKNP
jgi:hypothetical protein